MVIFKMYYLVNKSFKECYKLCDLEPDLIT